VTAQTDDAIDFWQAMEAAQRAKSRPASNGNTAQTPPQDDRGEPDGPATSHSALLLPEEFWNADDTLRHHRAYAHSRRASADAVLYNVLARISAMVPPECRIETGIGPERGAAAHLFVVTAGPSGRSKSSSKGVAKALIGVPESLSGDLFREELPIGSGEGIAEAYMGTTVEYDPSGKMVRGQPKEISVRKQVRHNAFFYLDEGEVFSKLQGREGAILGGTIRSAWVGDLIGTANADSAKYRVVPEGSYSLGMVIGFQPESIQPLLNDAHHGTPQRFLYCWVVDSTRARNPAKIAARKMTPVVPPRMITLDPDVAAEMADHYDNVTTGVIDVELLDAHAYLTRAKLAALLTLLCHPGTMHITKGDWRLAEIMWETSCKVRDHLIRYGNQADRQRQRAADHAHAEREGIAEIARSGQKSKIERVARNIAKYVHDKGMRTVGAVKTETHSRDRDVFDAALNYAAAQGWVAVDGTDLEPGDSRPSGRQS
jgi:hypothetical protein